MECLVYNVNVIHQSNEKEASDCTCEHNDRKEKKTYYNNNQAHKLWNK